MQRNNESTDQTGTQTTSTTNTTESGTQTPAKKRLNLRAAIDQPNTSNTNPANTSNIDLDATSNEVEADLANTSNTDLDDISNEVDLVNTSNTDLNTSNIDPYAAPVTAKPKNSAKTPSSTTPVDPDAPITFEPNQLQTGVHISHDLRIPPNNHSRDDFDQLADNVDNAFENSTPYYQSLLRTIRATIAKNPEKFSNQRYSLLVIQNDNGEDEEYFLIKRADRKSAEKSKLSSIMSEKLKRSSLLGAGCFGTVKVVEDADGNLFAVKKVKINESDICMSGEHNTTISQTRSEYLFYHNVIRPLLKQYPDLQDHVIVIKCAFETLNSKARPTIYQVMELAQGDFNQLITRLYPSEGDVLLTEETEETAFATKTYANYRLHQLITDPFTYKNLMLYLMAAVIKTFAHLEKHGIFHSDIKPDNLLFANGLFKAADMGGAAHIVDDKVIELVSSARDPGFSSPPEVAESEDFTGRINKKIEAWSVGLICLSLIYGKVRKFKKVSDSEREPNSKFHTKNPNYDEFNNNSNKPKFIVEDRKPGGKELIDFFRWAACDYLKNYDYTKLLSLIKNLPKNSETVAQDNIIEELISHLITMKPEERYTLEEAEKFLDEKLSQINLNYSEMKRLCEILFNPTLGTAEATKYESFSIRTSSSNQPNQPPLPRKNRWDTLRGTFLHSSRSSIDRNPSSSTMKRSIDRTVSSSTLNLRSTDKSPTSSTMNTRSSVDVKTITATNGKDTVRVDTSENNNNRLNANGTNGGWNLLRSFMRTKSQRHLGQGQEQDPSNASTMTSQNLSLKQ